LNFHSIKKIKYWIQAARVETLPLSISGIILGSFFAYYNYGFDNIIFLISIITAISFQILSNFANDYGDGILGTDNNRIGPKRVIASGKLTLEELRKGIIVNVFISITFSYSLIKYSFKNDYLFIVIFLFLSVFSILAAIKYTMGKTPYGYYGFGDIFVFVFFGLLSVFGSYFLQTKSVDYEVFILGAIVGFLCVGVLNLNNIRDIENDSKMDKKTIPTRIGFKNAKFYHYCLIISSILLIFTFATKFTISNNFIFIIVGILPISFHLYKVNQAKSPIEFKPLLKQLAISTFFFSIFMSIFLIYESIFF
jgi:1,4-dihydroxy-2-naphthoate octaprenyltransferase